MKKTKIHCSRWPYTLDGIPVAGFWFSDDNLVSWRSADDRGLIRRPGAIVRVATNAGSDDHSRIAIDDRSFRIAPETYDILASVEMFPVGSILGIRYHAAAGKHPVGMFTMRPLS